MNACHLIHRGGMALASRWRNVAYRALGVDFRRYCWLRAIEIPRNWTDIILHGCALDRGVVLLCSGPAAKGKIEIGEGTYINRYTILDAHGRIELGRNVMIGPHSFITDGNHGMKPGMALKSQPMEIRPVLIEDGVWIGAGVTILPGVRIGKDSVVGAGSVVTRDVEAGAIVVGSPARLLRFKSFPEAEIAHDETGNMRDESASAKN